LGYCLYLLEALIFRKAETALENGAELEVLQLQAA